MWDLRKTILSLKMFVYYYEIAKMRDIKKYSEILAYQTIVVFKAHIYHKANFWWYQYHHPSSHNDATEWDISYCHT